MSCYSCSTEFNFFKKEIGCNVCGFAFCSRCCKKRDVPSKQVLCNKCYDKITNEQVKTSKTSPPLAYKKRMASLKQSVSVDSSSFSEKDREIAERLQKLKRDRINNVLPSEEDIAERLAKLKGIEPSKYKAPPIEVYRRPDIRTCVEQATDLMKQMALEAELDSRLVKPEDEIAARLARLRDEPITVKHIEKPLPEDDLTKFCMEHEPSEEMDIEQVTEQFHKEHTSTVNIASKDVESLINDPDYKNLMLDIKKEKGETGQDSEDEEEVANKLVEKFLATDDVEGLDSLNDDSEEISKSEKDTTEEFPWCVICTDDAKIRCFDCDSDIYCLRCFKECHDSLDIKDHKTCPYLPDTRV